MQGTSTGRTNAGDAMCVCIHGHMGIFLSFCSLMRTVTVPDTWTRQIHNVIHVIWYYLIYYFIAIFSRMV